MMTFAEYNARLCDKDLQEYFQYLLLERAEKPENETIKETIAELQGIVLQGRLDGKTVLELREQCKLAADLAEQGKIEESIAKIQQILSVYPEHYSAFYTLGIISFEQGNFAEALDCFKQAFESNSFFVDAILRIFDCSVCLGDTSDANELLSKALAVQPEDPELLETKRHLESGTYPERLAKYMEVPIEKEAELKQELLKLKEMLESGNSKEALEKIKGLV
ncbi:MAG: tetratricopeptide repeat protein [Fibromonadaceae bacterium]|jgi:tetratricopeptide (TPR) repeat protein|nr:tetratricopeptide repeat protein [Fibromonadaceae bacterium]